MSKEFKTENDAINFIIELYFSDTRYNRIVLENKREVWIVHYE